MAQCDVTLCTREGTIERNVDAPFTMLSTSTQSRKTILICEECNKQDERMHQVGKPAAFGQI